MIINNLTQGSQAWHDFRAKHFTASDAAAMLGLSKYKTRDDLIHEKATGLTENVTPEKQALFNKGHQTEAEAREILEQETGEQLFPVTGTHDELQKIAASLDGIDMAGEWLFEHKLWSEVLVNFILTNQDLPDTHWPQVEQQLFVSGAEYCKFVVSDGTETKREILRYVSKPERLKQVLDGWKQFEKDLAEYTPPVVEVEVIAAPMATLPVLDIALSGSVNHTNLATYKEAALAVIGSIKTELVTDQDFADAKEQVKFCKKAEDELKAKKKQALEQTASISELFNAIDDLSEACRKTRLTLDKSIKQQDAAKKALMISDAQSKLNEHVSELNHSLAPYKITNPMADFAGAIKGKSSFARMQSALNDTLATNKIEANNAAALLKENIEYFKNTANGFEHLFPDAQAVLLMEKVACEAVIKSRIAEYEVKTAITVKDEPVAVAANDQIDEPTATEPAANDAHNPVTWDINKLTDVRHVLDQVRANLPQCETESANAVLADLANGLGNHIEIISAEIQSLSDAQRKAS